MALVSDFITDLTNTANFNTDFGGNNGFDSCFGAVTEVVVGDYYEGSYTATPTQAVQVFQTADKLMTQDFVVAPIPSNYGRVEWNGLYLKII